MSHEMSHETFAYRRELVKSAIAAILSNPSETVVRRYNCRPSGNGFDFNFQAIARDAIELADAIIEKEREVKT